ncbi:MAG TPA: alpha-L-rhamnosidase C-terminal domain-containing protein, partial [Terrimicrobiaceae bacterium]|nr:alpha-L-rhamnosidase C-terminal domain-containing protein [Terrimicrobiaceae bacterium]
SEGASHPGAAATRNVFRIRALEPLDHAPRKNLRWPLRSEPAGTGRFRSYLIDFGRTVVGCPEIQITGCAGGEMADLAHYETIDPARLRPDVDLDAHSRPALGCRVICRPGTNRHRFFLPYGFRYAVLTLRNTTRTVRTSLTLHTIGYPLAVRGSFASSDAGLNRIWTACAHTQRVCMLDAYVDTPWREQAQWWGDARVTCQNTFHLANDPRLMRRGIRSIAGQRVPNGLTYGHAPTVAHGCILPDFALIWIITLWDFFWQTGDLEPFHAHQDCLEGILGYFRSRTDPRTHLAASDPRYWLFLDWTTLHRQGFSSVLNLWLLLALEKTAELHRRSGQDGPARRLAQWARKLRTSLRSLIGRDGLMRDGRSTDGRIVQMASVHSQTLALMAGLHAGSERAMLEKRLLPWIREERVFEAQPSAYWATYVFRVLQERGYAADVVRFIRKHWEPMADYGSTWENFAPRRGADSFSHAWSAHPIAHFAQILGGVTQTGPAWTVIRFAPALLTDSGRVRIPTPQGMISSAWRRRGDGAFDVRLQLPPGTEAEIVLPRTRALCRGGVHRWQVLRGNTDDATLSGPAPYGAAS